MASSPSCTPFNTASATPKVICAARDANSQLMVNSSFDANIWNGFKTRPGVNMTGDPSCSVLGSTHASCGVRGTDNQLYINLQAEADPVALPPVASISPAALIRIITGNGTISVNVTANIQGGQPPYNFNWATTPADTFNLVAHGQTATVSASLHECDDVAGNLNLTITDAQGRTSLATATIHFKANVKAPHQCP